MLSANNITLQYGKRVLFDEVNIKFNGDNCYGVIGANGAGKSTFLKILSGEIDANKGSVSLEAGKRMAVLKQNHSEYDDFRVIDTVMMGHKDLWTIMKEKDAIYDVIKDSEFHKIYVSKSPWLNGLFHNGIFGYDVEQNGIDLSNWDSTNGGDIWTNGVLKGNNENTIISII